MLESGHTAVIVDHLLRIYVLYDDSDHPCGRLDVCTNARFNERNKVLVLVPTYVYTGTRYVLFCAIEHEYLQQQLRTTASYLRH